VKKYADGQSSGFVKEERSSAGRGEVVRLARGEGGGRDTGALEPAAAEDTDNEFDVVVVSWLSRSSTPLNLVVHDLHCRTSDSATRDVTSSRPEVEFRLPVSPSTGCRRTSQLVAYLCLSPLIVSLYGSSVAGRCLLTDEIDQQRSISVYQRKKPSAAVSSAQGNIMPLRGNVGNIGLHIV